MDMLSQGLGVYHMANENTSIGKYPVDARSSTTARRHFPVIFPFQTSRELTFKDYYVDRLCRSNYGNLSLAPRTRTGAPTL